MEMFEIEELMKGMNSKAYKAMLRNAAILNDPNVTEEMRRQALDNVKAIAANKPMNEIKDIKMKSPEVKIAKPKKVKATPDQAIKLAQIQATPNFQPAPAKLEYPTDLHLSPLNTSGHDENAMKGIFDALPDHEKKSVIDWHTKNKMSKSIDSLYSLFIELKKHI